MFDLAPAAQEMNRLLAGVRDDQLARPTPCPDWTVADLLAHVHQFSTVFTLNARKQPISLDGGLPDDWRADLARGLDELAGAWREEAAWQGRVSAGGIEMPAEQNALVAVEELVLHGWDLAAATGQQVRFGETELNRVEEFREVFAEPIASGEGPYGPPVAVPHAASRLERLVALAGRDPGWRA